MALSMEEQRILAEIEQNFARSEPVLAGRLARLEHPRPTLSGLLRSPRGRLVASLAALATLVLVSMVVYLFITLRGIPQRGVNGRPSASPRHPATATLGQTPGSRRGAAPAQISPGTPGKGHASPGAAPAG
ncbi:MAG TPA: DUF3040 domain-containing protein [Streptosporangiaceae bacterium]|jgi:hypothetical protein